MMRTDLLAAYLQQMPRLQAGESLVAATRVAVGTGSLKKGHGQRIQRSWQRTADHQRTPVIRPRSQARYQAEMRKIGLPIRPAGGAPHRPSPALTDPDKA